MPVNYWQYHIKNIISGDDMLVQNFKPINLETTLIDPVISESVMKMS